MNSTTVRWIVSGVLAVGAATLYIWDKKRKKHQNEESDSDANETPSFNKGGSEYRMFILKKHIVEEAIWRGLSKDIPGWKREHAPDIKKINELSKAATLGWGQIVVKILQKAAGRK